MSGPHTHDHNWAKYIRLGIDYGTGFLKLSVQYMYPGRNELANDIYDVELEDFNDDSVEIEQVGVWINPSKPAKNFGGKLIWGRRNTQKWLHAHRNDDKEVLSNWKLALMKDLRDREGVRATVKALGCLPEDHSILAALEVVITDHLRQIKSAVLDWCVRKHAANFRADGPDWTTLQWETQIAVPAMWDAVARGVMATAARDAGLDYVNLREEPQCVAGAVMSWLLSQDFINGNDAVIFFDVGAGTSDGTVVKFRHASTQAIHMKLERVGPSYGGPGGALVVNGEAWKAFVKKLERNYQGGVAGFCKRLKISEEECQRQVHEAVEMIKKRFGPDEEGPSHIAIYGRPTQHMSNAKPESVSFSRDEVERWHEVWAEMNERLLGDIIATIPGCRRAVFTGGGLYNRYLRHRLKATLKRHDIMLCEAPVKYPCSRGALLHYLFEPDKPMGDATFFTVQCEDFDPGVHTDVAAQSVSNPIIAHAAPYKLDKDQLVVYDRLMPIMQIIDHKEMPNNPIPMHFHVDSTDQGRLHFDVYRTQSDLHKPHGPLMDMSGNILPDMVPYPIAFVDLPKLYGKPLNFPRIEVPLSEEEKAKKAKKARKSKKGKSRRWAKVKVTGTTYYEVLGLVEMHKSNGSYELVIRLFNRDYEWQYDTKGKTVIHAQRIAYFSDTNSSRHPTTRPKVPRRPGDIHADSEDLGPILQRLCQEKCP